MALDMLTIGGVILGIIVLYVIFIFNRLVSLRNRIQNSWAQIDVQLQRRLDLIPNLVESVKGYMKYEKKVLTDVTKARTSLMNADSVGAKAKANDMLSGALKSLFAVAENYPKLEASQNFLQLQEELTATEDKISFARQFYNDSILEYVNLAQSFPANIFRGMLGFPENWDYFKAEEAGRKAVKVKLDVE